MEIKEILSEKSILEEAICNSLRRFEEETGLSISNVDLEHTQTMNKKGTDIAAVSLEIFL